MQKDPQHTPNSQLTNEEEFTLKSLLADRKKDFIFLWGHRKRILLFVILGAFFGVLAAWKLPTTYTAKISFVVEDTKSSSGGIMSALAGQFGLDLGGMMNSSNGILAGDNVLELLKSRKMIKATLLSPVDSGGNYTLADRYAEVYKLKKKWAKLKASKGELVQFPPQSENYTRLQDSLLQVIIKRIEEKELSVNKPDKKLSFFALNATMKDEELTALFSTRLLEEASEFYIQTKTKRIRSNVERLQHRADSIERQLNEQTQTVSRANQTLLDVNPAYTTARVNSEVQERDKRVLQTIYSEIVKNLEVSRTMLIQETPTFQVVDEADLPLKKNKLKFPKAILIGGFLAALLFSLFLLAFKNPKQVDSKTA